MSKEPKVIVKLSEKEKEQCQLLLEYVSGHVPTLVVFQLTYELQRMAETVYGPRWYEVVQRQHGPQEGE